LSRLSTGADLSSNNDPEMANGFIDSNAKPETGQKVFEVSGCRGDKGKDY